MARYKEYDYNQMQMVPVSLDEQLMPGTLEYAIHEVVENRLDLSKFDERYKNDETGRRAYSPKTLIKLTLLGYSRGMMGSRKLERACKENIVFMAMSCGQKPDHSTLAAFISLMTEEEIAELFTGVLLVCEEENLLGGTHFSLDGLKLPSNASKEWSGTHADLRKKKEKLEQKVREAVKEHKEIDGRGVDSDKERLKKKIDKLRKSAERIEEFLKDNEPKKGCSGKEIQSNITDNESAKLTTSHGVQQGYNANAVVDEENQVIVNAEVFGAEPDSRVMDDMLTGTKNNLEAVGIDESLKDKTVSADTAYFSKENLKACEEHEVDAYIPDPKFRKRDIRFEDAKRHRRSVDKHKKRYKSKKRWFKPEDFSFDDDTGKLMCPAGKSLYIKNRRVEIQGAFYTAYQATKNACTNCSIRSKCLRSKNTTARQVYILLDRRPGSITDKMREKIDTPQGRKTYSKRLGIVEPVFGNIRAHKKLDRFTLRGKSKVNIQWLLYCMVHNIEKLANFGQSYATAT
jgi:transposase/IS5 family transposase